MMNAAAISQPAGRAEAPATASAGKPVVVHLSSAPSPPPTMMSIFGGAALGAFVVLFVKPFVDWLYARIGQNRAYSYHMADRIRDFRESVAVINSIEYIGRRATFPIDAHVTKLGIADSLITDKAVDIKSLSHDTAADALNMSNLLANINRDCASILASKRAGEGEAYYKQLFELGDKMRNLSNGWETELRRFRFRHLRVRPLRLKPLSTRPKAIMYDDGDKLPGLAFPTSWYQPGEGPWPDAMPSSFPEA